MRLLDMLMEAFLIEAAALTKGSQRVMNDKKLVSALAARVRRDADFNPSVFPEGADDKFEKAPDEEVAQWFLENIDNIERAGYEGTIYSRDGLYSDWIVRNYINGKHTWEDLTGVMNMNLRDWTILKNRSELDTNHQQISSFNGVRDVGAYMVRHYADKLEAVRDAAKFAARDKMARAIPLINNEDYKIFATLNRAAACKLGQGTQWCTANSVSGAHFERYSAAAMLFQMFPAKPEEIKKKSRVSGKDITGKEKYQFDAGGPNFMDIADDPASAEDIRTKFPYLYTDLVSALKQNKGKIEELMKTFSEDPALQDPTISKVKDYDVDKEISKLKTFVQRGYMTDEVRPEEKVEKDDSGQEQPQLSPPTAPIPQQGQAPMESIKQLAQRMLEGKDLDEEGELDEDEEDTDQGIVPPSQTGGAGLGSMGAGAGPTAGGGQYPPGTAPTMPESFNHKGTEIMENVDKDVAAMLKSLKKYDTLVESCAPVLMARPKPYIAEEKDEEDKDMDEEEGEKVEESGKPWETDEEDEKDEKKPGEKSKTSKGGEVTKTEKGLTHKGTYGDDKKDKVEEGADPEVLAWMNRFSKLGNMKGYGR